MDEILFGVMLYPNFIEISELHNENIIDDINKIYQPLYIVPVGIGDADYRIDGKIIELLQSLNEDIQISDDFNKVSSRFLIQGDLNDPRVKTAILHLFHILNDYLVNQFRSLEPIDRNFKIEDSEVD